MFERLVVAVAKEAAKIQKKQQIENEPIPIIAASKEQQCHAGREKLIEASWQPLPADGETAEFSLKP